MWLLHVVVVQGGTGWQQGVTLALLALFTGGGFALLTGEYLDQDALLIDLALAAAAGAAANAAVSSLGTDIIAYVFGIRVLVVGAGGLLALCLAHDLVRLARRFGRAQHLPLSDRGGFAYLLLWLSGWPFEPGLVEATYDGDLQVKLLPEALHYQVRFGPLRGARVVPMTGDLTVEAADETLLLHRRRGAVQTDAALAQLQPDGRAAVLCTAIRRCMDEPDLPDDE